MWPYIFYKSLVCNKNIQIAYNEHIIAQIPFSSWRTSLGGGGGGGGVKKKKKNLLYKKILVPPLVKKK